MLIFSNRAWHPGEPNLTDGASSGHPSKWSNRYRPVKFLTEHFSVVFPSTSLSLVTKVHKHSKQKKYLKSETIRKKMRSAHVSQLKWKMFFSRLWNWKITIPSRVGDVKQCECPFSHDWSSPSGSRVLRTRSNFYWSDFLKVKFVFSSEMLRIINARSSSSCCCCGAMWLPTGIASRTSFSPFDLLFFFHIYSLRWSSRK